MTFAVADADATAAKADGLGGSVIVPPFDAPWVRMTVIADPQGATFIASKFTPENKDACPIFAGRLIRGVKNGPAPKWVQDRLKSVGMKSISALVDATNLISQDRGRPLHVFDADKLSGSLYARMAKDHEQVLALDEKTYVLDSDTIVVRRGAQQMPISIAQYRSECSSAAATGVPNGVRKGNIMGGIPGKRCWNPSSETINSAPWMSAA